MSTDNPYEDTEAKTLEKGRSAAVLLLIINASVAAIYIAGQIFGFSELAFIPVATVIAIQLIFVCVWFVPAFLYYLLAKKYQWRIAASKAAWSLVEVLGSSNV